MKEFANLIVADAESFDRFGFSPVQGALNLTRKTVEFALEDREQGEIMVIRVHVKVGTREELFPRKEAPDADAS